jgi:hypothetical protein
LRQSEWMAKPKDNHNPFLDPRHLKAFLQVKSKIVQTLHTIPESQWHEFLTQLFEGPEKVKQNKAEIDPIIDGLINEAKASELKSAEAGS